MLIEFRVKNFKSFKDEQVFSMVASSDSDLPDNFIVPGSSGKQKLLKSAVLYGANASGKSNFIEAISFLENFVTRNVAQSNRGARIDIQPFLLDRVSANSPSEFEIHFIHQNVRYQYGLSLDTKRIYTEWLIAYPKSSPQVWFERKPKTDSEASEWYFGPRLSGEKQKLTDLTRPDIPFLSVAANFNHKQLSEVHNWFLSQLHVISANPNNQFFERFTAVYSKNNELSHTKIKTLLQQADLGISDFSIQEKNVSEDELSDDMPIELGGLILSGKARQLDIKINHYSSELANSDIQFPIENESLGTRRLFAIAGFLISGLEDGNILVIDELDASLHPILVQQIVKLFHDPEFNNKGAQLIFNTHDTTLLDTTLFRRDQIWFAEKDNQGASHLYPLSDFSPRKDEALQKGYLHGRYGAVALIAGSLLESITNA